VQVVGAVVAGGADAVMVQEHHLQAHEIDAASVWCLTNGWKSVWSPAVLTDEGGTSSGVAILVRADVWTH